MNPHRVKKLILDAENLAAIIHAHYIQKCDTQKHEEEQNNTMNTKEHDDVPK